MEKPGVVRAGQTPLFGNEGSVGRGGSGWGSQLASGLSESNGLHSELCMQIRTAHTQTHIETCMDTDAQTAPCIHIHGCEKR